jgi:FKBP-type peptidyl-prolyl cis-trans isomerase FklB
MELKSETDRESYALGYQIGGDFQRNKMDLNAAAVIRGIADARAGNASLMTDKEMRSTLIELKRKVVAQERAALPQIDKSSAMVIQPDAQAEPKIATATAAHARRGAPKTTPGAREFLRKNAQREGIATLPNGLQYRVIKDGSGKQPQATDNVALIYRGTLVNGNEFGNTDQDGKSAPKTFSVASLVPGMREAVTRMKEGAQWQVFVPPQMGFGAGTPLYRKVTVFDVQLVAVNP